MCKKIFTSFVIMSVIGLMTFAFAQNPPAPTHPATPPYINDGGTLVSNNAGWGEDCTDWVKYENGFTWDLIYDDDFNDYRKCDEDNAVVWPELAIDLYVELSTRVHWDHTQVYIHRYDSHIDGGKTFYIVFSGWLQSNEGNIVQITPSGGWDLTKLVFKDGVPGLPSGGPDINIQWQKRGGDGLTATDPNTGSWTEVTDPNDLKITHQKCDHWFQFRACITLDKHLNEGHYAWEGVACPLPVL